MKKIAIVLIAGLFTFATLPGLAKHGHKGSFDEAAWQEKKEKKINKKMDKLTKKLALSDEQQKQVRQVLESKWKKKIRIYREKQGRMERLRKEFHDNMSNILKPEQQKKFDALYEKWNKKKGKGKKKRRHH